MSLTVLITNLTLTGRSGTVIQTRNVAMELHRRGFKSIVYAPELGEVASDLRTASIPVVDDLADVTCRVDVIHGQHTPTTATAIARFPSTPALFVGHDALAWHDTPPALPSIRRYIAVDAAVEARMRTEHHVPADRLRVLLNQPDIDGFRPGPRLPSTPRRAVVFAKNAGHIAAIRDACVTRNLEVDVVGLQEGRVVDNPAAIMARYDLVFGTALTALEAMACGRAVVACDGRGMAGFVDPERYVRWRPFNFGLRTLTSPLTAEAIGAEIDRYDPSQAERVCDQIRSEGGLHRYGDDLVALYREVIANYMATPPTADAVAAALAAHIRQWSPRTDPRWPWMVERQALLAAIHRLQTGDGGIRRPTPSAA